VGAFLAVATPLLAGQVVDVIVARGAVNTIVWLAVVSLVTRVVLGAHPRGRALDATSKRDALLRRQASRIKPRPKCERH
jgi:ABC-type bacteriocin/lantibiotic exporter with double-glycine peptidase domain